MNSAWITEDLIWPYSEYRDKYKSSQRPSRVFQEAIETAEDLFKSLSTEKVALTIQLKCKEQLGLDAILSECTLIHYRLFFLVMTFDLWPL